MAIDKVSLNPFVQAFGSQKAASVQQTPAVTKQPPEQVAGAQKPTEIVATNQNTVGVNANIGIGDSMNIPAQAGKPAGLGKTLYFA